MSKFNLGVTLAGVAISAPGWANLVPTPWDLRLAWAGVALSIIGAVRQYRESIPYVRHIAKCEWLRSQDGAEISFHPQDHKKGTNAEGEIYALNETGGYHACMIGVELNDGVVRFATSGEGIDCKIIIR